MEIIQVHEEAVTFYTVVMILLVVFYQVIGRFKPLYKKRIQVTTTNESKCLKTHQVTRLTIFMTFLIMFIKVILVVKVFVAIGTEVVSAGLPQVLIKSSTSLKVLVTFPAHIVAPRVASVCIIGVFRVEPTLAAIAVSHHSW